MSAKTGFRGLAGLFQKTMMVALVLVVLFSSLPVGRAQAAIGAFDATVNCKQGHYDYRFHVRGANNHQYVAFRTHEFYVQANGTVVFKKLSGWYYVWADTYLTLNAKTVTPNYASYGTRVRVVTEVLFWDNLTNRYHAPIFKRAGHIDILNTGPWTDCQIW